MFRVALGLSAAVISCGIIATSALADSAKTIRIEPRAFYGATVSLEAGVRVFRPLPPTTHMIINPNKTPLNLTIKDEKKTIINRTVTQHVHGGYSAGDGGYALGGFSGYGRKMRGGKHHRRGHGRRNRGI